MLCIEVGPKEFGSRPPLLLANQILGVKIVRGKIGWICFRFYVSPLTRWSKVSNLLDSVRDEDMETMRAVRNVPEHDLTVGPKNFVYFLYSLSLSTVLGLNSLPHRQSWFITIYDSTGQQVRRNRMLWFTESIYTRDWNIANRIILYLYFLLFDLKLNDTFL